jgi:predicted RNA-binding protein with PUA-like domain
MAYWLLKTEPNDYSFDDLVREKRTVWDGVTNNWAQKFIRDIRDGDEVVIYHSGKEKCLAGTGRVCGNIYSDPTREDEKLMVFDVEPVKKLSGGITLSRLKEDSFFADFLLVKFTRLSVLPVEEKIWSRIMQMEAESSGRA